jgi:3-deoxy-D-manno-octulosonate 8-phosphate phosphatase (KDO 8-P phosphatase)
MIYFYFTSEDYIFGVPYMTKSKLPPKYFILDVDGVFTDGKFHYTSEGKVMKTFGDADSDALHLLKDRLYIHMVSGDKRGFPITYKRIAEDMKFPLDQVSTFDRIAWMKEKWNPGQTIYMGDGIFDPLVFKEVFYAIAPANAFYTTKEAADFVTKSRGGEGAVAEAVLHILETFYEPFDLHSYDFSSHGGAWTSESHK